MTILLNFTSRSRPYEAYDVFCNIAATVEKGDDIDILLKLDLDDPKINGYERLRQSCKVASGGPSSKIGAINRDIPKTGWDILVNISDDMRFSVRGWETIIRDLCGPDTFLHLPDQYAGQKLCTMSIIGREYYNRFGYIYHPSYRSFYADEEATEVARKLGCYRLGPEGVIEHRHPAAGAGSNDDLYRRNQRYWNTDKQNFRKRKMLGFPK